MLSALRAKNRRSERMVQALCRSSDGSADQVPMTGVPVRRLRSECPSRRPFLRVFAGAVGLTAAGLVPISATPASAAATANVSGDGSRSLASIPSAAFGMNVAVYDGYMNDSPVPGLLKGAGIGAVRYPGGSYADIYHWKTNPADGGYVAPNTDFDTYMGTVRAAGAQPVVIANYGSGTSPGTPHLGRDRQAPTGLRGEVC